MPGMVTGIHLCSLASARVRRTSCILLKVWFLSGLQDLLAETGYAHRVSAVQRSYGPPPNWKGPQPGEGHEVSSSPSKMVLAQDK